MIPRPRRLTAVFLAVAGPATAAEPVVLAAPRQLSDPPATVAPPPAYAPVAPFGCDTPPAADCSLPCPPAPGYAVCGPRLRVMAPAPQVVFRTTRERRVVEAAPCQPEPVAGCSAGCGGSGPGFGSTPARPSTTTVHVPYTYMVPVPTYAVVPHTGFGAVGFGATQPVGFGAVQSVGFGGVAPAGAVSFGGVGVAGVGQAVGFGGVAAGQGNAQSNGFGSAGVNDATLRAAITLLTADRGTRGGFGAAGGTGDDCKQELVALTARLDALEKSIREQSGRTGELVDKMGKLQEIQSGLYKAVDKLADKVGAHGESLAGVATRLGSAKPDDKPLSVTLAELNAGVEELKAKVKKEIEDRKKSAEGKQ